MALFCVYVKMFMCLFQAFTLRELSIPASTHFVITASSHEDDIKETRYFKVDIEQLNEEEYQEQIEGGAKEIFDI